MQGKGKALTLQRRVHQGQKNLPRPPLTLLLAPVRHTLQHRSHDVLQILRLHSAHLVDQLETASEEPVHRMMKAHELALYLDVQHVEWTEPTAKVDLVPLGWRKLCRVESRSVERRHPVDVPHRGRNREKEVLVCPVRVAQTPKSRNPSKVARNLEGLDPRFRLVLYVVLGRPLSRVHLGKNGEQAEDLLDRPRGRGDPTLNTRSGQQFLEMRKQRRCLLHLERFRVGLDPKNVRRRRKENAFVRELVGVERTENEQVGREVRPSRDNVGRDGRDRKEF